MISYHAVYGHAGISLVADQWDSLVKGLPALEAALP